MVRSWMSGCLPLRVMDFHSDTPILEAQTYLPKSPKFSNKTRVRPYPLGAGSARPNPKMGAPDPENPLFLGFFCAQRGIETMVWEGARPWDRGRSGDYEKCPKNSAFARRFSKSSNKLLSSSLRGETKG